MSTQLKCDHCRAVKAEGLRPREFFVIEALGDKSAKDNLPVATFVSYLCYGCQDKLVVAMQSFLKCKPSVPGKGE